jgi:hypothetical protein
MLHFWHVVVNEAEAVAVRARAARMVEKCIVIVRVDGDDVGVAVWASSRMILSRVCRILWCTYTDFLVRVSAN